MAILTMQVMALACCLPMFAQTREAVAPTAPTYLQAPFDPTCVRLPARFPGNDIVRWYRAYEALHTAEKNEYETQDQFNKRMTLAENRFFMGGLETTLAFVVPTMSQYDADARTLNGAVVCSDPHGERQSVSNAILVRQRRSEKQYIGTNAFGVKVSVHETSIESFQIGVTNPDDFRIDTAKYSIVSSINSTPDEARRIKSTLAALAICSIKRGDTLIADDFILKKATFDDPNEYRERMYFLNTKLLAIWFFDSSSGKIYTKLQPIK
jgi:hypothetical protein